MNQRLKRGIGRILVVPSIMLGFFCLVYLSGCNKDNNTKETPTKNIWELVQNTTGLDSLSKYLALYPDLVSTLQGSGTLTLFAPNNDAFAGLMATPGFPSDIKQINPDLIKNVLLYHIADKAYNKSDLTSGTEVTTEEMEDITVNDDGTLKTGATNPNIEIDMADIEATNGVMHTTKSVLIPPTVGASITPLLGTVAGTLMLGADFSVLAKAIQRADSVVPSGQPSLISIFASTSSNVTIFAPPNAVFTAAKINVSDYSGTIWRNIILYHAISGTKKLADLTARSYTSLMGEDLYITQTTAGDYVDGYPIVVPDAAPASNGTVHVLAGFLLPGVLLGGNLYGVLNAQGLDSMAVAVDLAGLKSTLQGTTAYTVFAPPNEAFAALLNSMGLSSLAQFDQADHASLAGLISNHVIAEYNFTSDFTDGATFTTLAGASLTSNVQTDSLSFTDGSGAVSGVVFTNIKATNGVIHVIGGILKPQ